MCRFNLIVVWIELLAFLIQCSAEGVIDVLLEQVIAQVELLDILLHLRRQLDINVLSLSRLEYMNPETQGHAAVFVDELTLRVLHYSLSL